jgi:hypothetical protein
MSFIQIGKQGPNLLTMIIRSRLGKCTSKKVIGGDPKDQDPMFLTLNRFQVRVYSASRPQKCRKMM